MLPTWSLQEEQGQYISSYSHQKQCTINALRILRSFPTNKIKMVFFFFSPNHPMWFLSSPHNLMRQQKLPSMDSDRAPKTKLGFLWGRWIKIVDGICRGGAA